MQERELFHAALEHQDPHLRAAFLEEACGQDTGLRVRVEELLTAHADAGSFLEKTPAELAARSAVTEVGQTSAGTDDTIDWLELLGPSDHPDALGTYGSYHIMELIGRGGFGVVLRAHDPQLERPVAVKLLAPEVAASPTSVRRFLREARAAAAISHDHVVTIHAIDEDTSPPMIVMEYVAGQSLQQKIDRVGVLDILSILRIGLQTAGALSAAHRQGLVHRDIKPSNILLENSIERVKLTDFGLARAIDDTGLTQTGQITGTPQYMSPEQAQGHAVDFRTDLFSLGCVLYAACTGRAAFRGDSAVSVLHQVVHQTPRPVQELNADIPDWLCEIIAKLMEKDPGRRFQSTEELQDLLTGHLTHLQQPDRAPQPGPLQQPEPLQPEASREESDPSLPHGRSAPWEKALLYWMTPKPPEYVRLVSIPMLVLLGVWMIALVYVMAYESETVRAVVFLAGNVGLPLVFVILSVLWWGSQAGRDHRSAIFPRGPISPMIQQSEQRELQPEVGSEESDPSLPHGRSPLETLLSFWMKPQPGFGRFVGLPCLVLLGVWMTVFLGAVVADTDEAIQVLLFFVGVTGLPLAFTILTLFWSRSPARLGPETVPPVPTATDVPFTVMERVLSWGMTPQPGFVRRVSLPCLILLGVLLGVCVVSAGRDTTQGGFPVELLATGAVGLAILFLVLTALWAKSRARPGLPLPVLALTVMGMMVCLPLSYVSYRTLQGPPHGAENESGPLDSGREEPAFDSGLTVEPPKYQWFSRSPDVTTVESQVLRTGFSRLYIDYLVSTGRDVSGEADYQAQLSQMIDRLRFISPQFLRVSPEQETVFATQGLNVLIDFNRLPEEGVTYMLATLGEVRSRFLPLTSFAVTNFSSGRRTLLESHIVAQLLAVEIERSGFTTGPGPDPNDNRGTQAGEELSLSPVLRNGYTRIVEDFLTENGRDGSPQKANVSEIRLLQMIAQSRAVSPAFLKTSPQQEQRFERGEFDEVSTLQNIQKNLQMLTDFDLKLQPMTAHAVQQFRADEYRGVQLEVTKQLLEIEVARLIRNLQ